jgi:hypothetical protein
MAIRSQAWSGTGGQDGSETRGVSPNNNPRLSAPGLLGTIDLMPGVGERVQASWKREGP